MARTTAREAAMQLVYERLMGGGGQQSLGDLIPAPEDAEDLAFIEGEVSGVYGHVEQIDALIEANAKGWSMQRLARVDLAILRLAIYELLYRQDIPPGASINEAVELSHKYSTDEAGAFINGVLGSVTRSLPQRS